MAEGLNIILRRIHEAAGEEKQAILAAAREKAGQITASAAADASALAAAAETTLALETRRAEERRITAVQNEKRDRLLAEKGALVKEVFAEAKERLSALDEKKALAFWQKRLTEALDDLALREQAFAAYGEEDCPPVSRLVLTMAEKERALGEPLIAALAGKVKAMGKEIALAPPSAALSGGFLLTAGEVVTDSSLDTLFAALEESMAKEVAALLFAPQKD